MTATAAHPTPHSLLKLAEAVGTTTTALAPKIGLAGRGLDRARTYGLDTDQAIRAAKAVGVDPHTVWPDLDLFEPNRPPVTAPMPTPPQQNGNGNGHTPAAAPATAGRSVFPCPDCPRTFKREGWLRQHATLSHGPAPAPAPPAAPKKPRAASAPAPASTLEGVLAAMRDERAATAGRLERLDTAIAALEAIQ